MSDMIMMTTEQPVAWMSDYAYDGGPVIREFNGINEFSHGNSGVPVYLAPQLPRVVLMQLAKKIADEAYHLGALGLLFEDTQLAARVDAFQPQTQQSVTDIELTLTAENQKRLDVERQLAAAAKAADKLAKEAVTFMNQRDQLLAALKAITYENDGRHFVGIHGDTDVTDEVGVAIAAVKGGAE